MKQTVIRKKNVKLVIEKKLERIGTFFQKKKTKKRKSMLLLKDILLVQPISYLNPTVNSDKNIMTRICTKMQVLNCIALNVITT